MTLRRAPSGAAWDGRERSRFGAVRAIRRHRAGVVADGAQHLQHRQKSLTQMNLHLHHVLCDLSGVIGT
jgi:transposase